MQTRSGCHLSLFVPGCSTHCAVLREVRAHSCKSCSGRAPTATGTLPPETHQEVTGISGDSSKACKGLWGQRRDQAEGTSCTFGKIHCLGTCCLCSTEYQVRQQNKEITEPCGNAVKEARPHCSGHNTGWSKRWEASQAGVQQQRLFSQGHSGCQRLGEVFLKISNALQQHRAFCY